MSIIINNNNNKIVVRAWRKKYVRWTERKEGRGKMVGRWRWVGGSTATVTTWLLLTWVWWCIWCWPPELLWLFPIRQGLHISWASLPDFWPLSRTTYPLYLNLLSSNPTDVSLSAVWTAIENSFLSLSLSRTHTHTHTLLTPSLLTHYLSLSLTHSLSFFLSLRFPRPPHSFTLFLSNSLLTYLFSVLSFPLFFKTLPSKSITHCLPRVIKRQKNESPFCYTLNLNLLLLLNQIKEKKNFLNIINEFFFKKVLLPNFLQIRQIYFFNRKKNLPQLSRYF